MKVTELDKTIDYVKGRIKSYQTVCKPLPFENYKDYTRGCEKASKKLKHYELILSALEKQRPTKPIYQKWSPTRCPSCDEELSESVGDGYYKDWESLTHCECGQKLDWR